MIKYQHFKILAVRGLHITKMSVLSLKETLLLLSVTAATFSLWWEISVGFPSSPLAVSLNPVFHYYGQKQWRCSQGGVEGLRGSGFVFQALSVWQILFLLHGPVKKLDTWYMKDTQFSNDDGVKRTDGERVLGQWAGFGLLQFFIVQMKRVNIIHLDRAAWKKGLCLSLCVQGLPLWPE